MKNIEDEMDEHLRDYSDPAPNAEAVIHNKGAQYLNDPVKRLNLQSQLIQCNRNELNKT